MTTLEKITFKIYIISLYLIENKKINVLFREPIYNLFILSLCSDLLTY